MRWVSSEYSNTLGAVHKVRHTIFDPPPLSHLSHILGSPKVRHTSRTPPIFSRSNTKSRTKAPCTNSLSIVCGSFCPGVLSGGLFSGRFCPGWFLSVPPSVRKYQLQQKIEHHFKFHASYV